MSKSIDERVVEMQFDNAKFEKNVKTSMKTLEKLKEALSFKRADKNLDKLNKSLKNVDLSAIESGVDKISKSFTMMGRIGIHTMDRLASYAVQAGIRMGHSLTIDPVKSGYSEYELKIEAIKTIMNATGESEENVIKKLDELNEYSDRTIYSFSDMTQNIGKFVNNSIPLDDAVEAMKGISNAAALSGQGARQASSVMYNMAQSLSSFLNTRDWYSVETANMATTKLKETFIETAVELGTLQKTADGLYKTLDGKHEVSAKNFRETLEYRWGAPKVIIETLKKFADEDTELGRAAYAAATQVTTTTKLFDTIKESIQSGWAQSWELVIGTLNEATSTLTGFNAGISKLIESSTKARNTSIKLWKDLGGRTSLINTFQNLFHIVTALNKEIISGIFSAGPSMGGEKLYKMTRVVEEITEKIKKFLWSTNEFDGEWPILAGIRRGVSGIRAVFGIVSDAVWSFRDALQKGSTQSVPVLHILVAAFAKLGDWLHNFREEIKAGGYFETFFSNIIAIAKPIARYIPTILDHIKIFFNSIGKAFSQFDIKGKLIQGVLAFSAFLPKLSENIWNFGVKIYKTISSGGDGKLKAFFVNIGMGLMNAFDALVEGFNKFDGANFPAWLKDTVLSIFGKLKDAVKNALVSIFGEDTWASVKANPIVQKITGVLSAIGSGIAEGVYSVISTISTFNGANLISSIRSSLKSLFAILKKTLVSIYDSLFGGGAWEKLKNSKAAAWITDAIHTIGNALSMAFNWLKTTLAGIDLSGIKAWFSDTFGGISDSLDEKGKALKKTGQNVGDWIKSFVSKISPTRIILFGTTLLALVSVFKIVKTAFSLVKQLVPLTGLIVKVIAKKFFGVEQNAGSFADSCKAFALAIGILAGAIYVIAKLPMSDAWRAVAQLATLMIGMYAVTFAMNSLSSIKDIGTTILKFSGGIALLAYAIKMLANMKNLDKAGEAIQQLLDFVANVEVLGLLSSGIRKLFGITGGLSVDILSLGGGLLAMVFAIRAFSAMKLETIKSALPKMMLVIGALGLMMDILTAVGQHLLGLDPAKGTMKIKGLVSMAVALTILMIPLKVIAGMTSKEFQQGMEGLLGLMTFMAILAGIAGWSEFKFGNGAGFLALSAAILLLVPAMLALALIPPGPLASASLGMAAITAAMSVLAKTAKKMKKLGFKGIISMLAVAVTASEMMWVFAESLSKVGDMDWKTIAAFSLGLSVAILAISRAVSIIGNLDIGKILKGCLGLVAVAAALGLGMNILLGLSGGAIVSFTRDLLQIGSNLGAFADRVKDVDPEQFKAVGEALTILGTVCAANFLASFTSDGAVKVSRAGLQIASNLNSFCRRLTDFDKQKVSDAGDALRDLSDKLSGVTDNSDAVKGFATSLTDIGSGFQNFLSSISGYGIVGSVKIQNAKKTMNSIRDMAVSMQETTGIAETITDVSVATTNLGAAIGLYNEMAGGISGAGANAKPEDVGRGLASMINSLVEELPDDTAMRQIASYAEGASGSGNLTQFSLGLKAIATAMGDYGKECKNLRSDRVELGNKVLDKISEVPKKLGKKDGLLDFFTGRETSLSEFANGITAIGTGLKGFSEGANAIKGDAVTNSGAAIDMLVNMQNKLNGDASFWNLFKSKETLSDFSDNFPALADGLAEFYLKTWFIKSSKMKGATTLIGSLIDLANRIQNEGTAAAANSFGGWGRWASGFQDLASFSTQFVTLGDNLQHLATATADVDPEKLNPLIGIATKLSDIEHGLANIKGKKGLGDFGGRIESLGKNLKQFYQTVNEVGPDEEGFSIDPTSLNQVYSILERFIEIQGKLNKLSGGDKTLSFSSVLQQTGDYINSFAGDGKLGTGYVEQFENAAAGISHIASAFDKWRTAGARLVSELLSGIEAKIRDGYTALSTSVHAMVANILSALNSYQGAFVTSGRNFTYGVARGIGDSGAVQSAVSAAVSVARKALSALNSALDEHSPSKETTKSGQFFTEGFVQGISKTADGASDAAASVAEEIIEGFNGTLGIHSESTVAYQSAQWWNRGFRHAMKDERVKTVDEAKKTSDEIAKVSDPERNGLVKAFEKGTQKIGKIIEDVTKKTGTTFKDWNLDTVTDMFGKYEELGSNGLEDYLNRIGASAEEKKFAEYLRIYGKAALEKLGLGGLLGKGDTSKIDEAIKNSGSGVSKVAVDMAKITSIFDAIAKIGSSVDLLGSRVSSMQIVMDSGELVGSIENKIDSRLGTLTALRGRGI